MADSGVTVPRNDRAVPSTRYRTGYDAVAADYAEWVNNDFATKPLDRALLAAFAELVHANGAGPPLHLTSVAASWCSALVERSDRRANRVAASSGLLNNTTSTRRLNLLAQALRREPSRHPGPASADGPVRSGAPASTSRCRAHR
jgi:hypothetical protein